MKKWIAVLLSAILTGCSVGNTIQPASTAESSENPLAEYKDLPEENQYVVSDKEEIEKMLAHGTGVVYFSFPECPWCQRYSVYLNEVASQYDVLVKYYNIHEDRGTDWYDQIALTLKEKGSIARYDADGNLLIYMPLVVFLKEGEIIGYEDTSCDLDSDEISVADFWTEDKVQEVKNTLGSLFETTKQNLDAANKAGCAVKVEEDGCN